MKLFNDDNPVIKLSVGSPFFKDAPSRLMHSIESK